VRVLVIDTSAGPTAAIVEAPGSDPLAATVVESLVSDSSRRHAEELAPAIDALVTRHGVPGLVVVGTGPGPFTGLRVGLVTARTLARGWGIDVAGVPSLDAIARGALDDPSLAGRSVLVATDARRREVYLARYSADGPAGLTAHVPASVASPAVAAGHLGAGDVVVGGVADAVLAAGGEAASAHEAREAGVDPAAMARLALARLAAGARLDTEPLYLRRPDAVAPAQARP
jgi:tRNA threonylcarbamoyladenosine biosynthesis protein TsaB